MWNVRMDFETLTVKLVSTIYQSEPIPWYTKIDSILYRYVYTQNVLLILGHLSQHGQIEKFRIQ